MSDRKPQHAKVSANLGGMNRIETLDRFHLYNDPIGDHQIRAVLADELSLVENRHSNLAFEIEPRALKLD